MSSLAIPRPTADDAAPYYQTYIGKVGGENIVEQLAAQLTEVERLFGSADDRSALARYAPDKWSIKEVLGHLADVERIFGYRLLRISRGDPTPLPGFDQDAYVPAGRFDEQPLKSLVQGFRTVRQSSISLIESIPPQAWALRGEASGNPVSARALAYILVGHVTHHLGVLRERYHLGRPKVHS
jgi:hypothetical protein